MSINCVTLTGRTTADIELKVSESGIHRAHFTLAVDSGYSDKKKTYFLPVTAFGKLADTVSQFVKKGSKIGIAGTLTSSSYTDAQDVKHTSIQVVANNISFENLKDGSTSDQAEPSENFEGYEVSEDDIPF